MDSMDSKATTRSALTNCLPVILPPPNCNPQPQHHHASLLLMPQTVTLALPHCVMLQTLPIHHSFHRDAEYGVQIRGVDVVGIHKIARRHGSASNHIPLQRHEGDVLRIIRVVYARPCAKLYTPNCMPNCMLYALCQESRAARSRLLAVQCGVCSECLEIKSTCS